MSLKFGVSDASICTSAESFTTHVKNFNHFPLYICKEKYRNMRKYVLLIPMTKLNQIFYFIDYNLSITKDT